LTNATNYSWSIPHPVYIFIVHQMFSHKFHFGFFGFISAIYEIFQCGMIFFIWANYHFWLLFFRIFSSIRPSWAAPIQQLPIPMNCAASIIVCAAIATIIDCSWCFPVPKYYHKKKRKGEFTPCLKEVFKIELIWAQRATKIPC
jgi:hypothetical protein